MLLNKHVYKKKKKRDQKKKRGWVKLTFIYWAVPKYGNKVVVGFSFIFRRLFVVEVCQSFDYIAHMDLL